MDSIPIFDLDTFHTDKKKATEELGRICREVGFFYVKTNEIEPSIVENVFSKSKKLFELPEDVKESIKWTSEHNRGFVAMEREKLNPKMKRGDPKESFNVGKEHNRWPPLDSIQDLEKLMMDFYDRCLDLGCKLLSIYALALGLPEDFFEVSHRNQLGSDGTTLRFLHYPPVSDVNTSRNDESHVRAGAHSDYGSITLLFQHRVSGLEVLSKTGQWVPVPPIPNTIVVNTGDLMQRWTSDQFCSTIHRVVLPDPQEQQVSRYSIAFFFHPRDDYLVTCLPLPNQKNEKYPPITAGDYLLGKLSATY